MAHLHTNSRQKLSPLMAARDPDTQAILDKMHARAEERKAKRQARKVVTIRRFSFEGAV